jgi:hypothetical protein
VLKQEITETKLSSAGTPEVPKAASSIPIQATNTTTVPAPQTTGATVIKQDLAQIQAGAVEATTKPAIVAPTLPRTGTPELLKVYALSENRLAKIIERYNNRQPNGGRKFTQPFHVISIDVKKVDQATNVVADWEGFHHDYRRILRDNGIVGCKSKREYANGFYSEKIKYGMQDFRRKSFFPAEWEPEKVLNKILEASENIKSREPARIPGRQKLVCWLPKEQQDICIIVNENDDIVTAYPDFSKKKAKL